MKVSGKGGGTGFQAGAVDSMQLSFSLYPQNLAHCLAHERHSETFK